MQDYKKLEVWRKAHMLVKDIYSLTIAFPKEELYGLVSQIRRAAISVPTNIAEGAGKGSKADFGRYLQIVFGSANEIKYSLFLAFELKYISQDNFEPLNSRLEEIKKMISGLLKSVNRPL